MGQDVQVIVRHSGSEWDTYDTYRRDDGWWMKPGQPFKGGSRVFTKLIGLSELRGGCGNERLEKPQW
jgi:hypothetical protein